MNLWYHYEGIFYDYSCVIFHGDTTFVLFEGYLKAERTVVLGLANFLEEE